MLIFIYGDDSLRVKERVAEMRQKFIAKFDPASMNVDEFGVRDGQEAERGEIIGAVQASPFLSEKRLVIIRGLVSSLKKTEVKHWLMGFSRVPDSTVMIFADVVVPATQEKSELFKALQTQPDVHVYPLQQLQGHDLLVWANARAMTHNALVASAALSTLLARVGNDSWRIDAELQKLAAYARGTTVTETMITELVRAESHTDIFGFMDALTADRSNRALHKLAEERLAGADEFQLFGMLLRQIRLFIQARALLDDQPGVTKQGLVEVLAVHPFVAQKLLATMRGWSKPRLEALHKLACGLDKAMKTGLSPQIAVDRLASAFLRVS